jgi:hypothetical protein
VSRHEIKSLEEPYVRRHPTYFKVVRHVQVECRHGICQVVLLGGAHDGCIQDRVLQYPRHGNLRHRHAAGLGDALNAIDDRLVVVEPQWVPIEVGPGRGLAPCGAALSHGRVTRPPANGLQGMLPMP